MASQAIFENVIVDSTRKYQVNAGFCEKCGYYKTWGYRIKNPKTGKMMPGHVTEDGYKIDEGECPSWKALKEKRLPKSVINETLQKSDPARQLFINEANDENESKYSIKKNGNRIILSANGKSVHLGEKDALQLARSILDLIIAP